MSYQPVPTLYVSNIEGKVKKTELRQQLYSLFTTYGRVIDVVALKTGKMRGQAFVVFQEQAAATSALRALTGEEFYGKPLKITYAKSESLATRRLADPTSLSTSETTAKKQAKLVISRAEEEFQELEKERQEEEEGRGKRDRDGSEDLVENGKRRKVEEEDEEMEMDEDDEESGPSVPTTTNGITNVSAPPPNLKVSTILLATSLPPEANDEALSTLFEQYSGFQSIQSLPTGSTPTKSASIVFSSLSQAEEAQRALDGFLMKPGWPMGVVVVPADAL